MQVEFVATPTHVGESYGTTYREHYVEVYAFDESGWYWSVTHPIHCDERGATGKAEDRPKAERRALGAVDALKCGRKKPKPKPGRREAARARR